MYQESKQGVGILHQILKPGSEHCGSPSHLWCLMCWVTSVSSHSVAVLPQRLFGGLPKQRMTQNTRFADRESWDEASALCNCYWEKEEHYKRGSAGGKWFVPSPLSLAGPAGAPAPRLLVNSFARLGERSIYNPSSKKRKREKQNVNLMKPYFIHWRPWKAIRCGRWDI